jgi:hypothetical protein
LGPAAQTFSDRLAELTPKLSEVDLLKVGPQYTTSLQSLSSALPGVTSGVLLAVEGFEDGDELAGVQGILDACASLAGPLAAGAGAAIGAPIGAAGPGAAAGYLVGALIGSIFSMISEILGFFAPQTESLAKTIRNLLEDQKAEEAQSDIRKVHNSFLVYATTLNDECATISSSRNFLPGATAKVIDQLNFVEGNAMTTYWQVIDWLANKNHQNHRLWPLILNGACNAYALLLVAVVRIQSVVSTTRMWERYDAADERGKGEFHELWNSAIAKLKVYSICNRLNLEQLRNLTPAVQSRGTLWRLVANLECGVVDPSVTPSNFGGNDRRLSVTVCSKDQTRPDPPYYEYAVAWPSVLYYRRVTSSANKVADMEAARDTLDEQPHIDVFATPGTDLTKPSHACVYQLLDGGKKIQGKYRDENGKDIGDICSFVLPTTDPTNLTSVRAVHDPYALADDFYRGRLKGIKYIVYAARQSSDQIVVLLNGKGKDGDGKTPHYLSIPFEAKGIAVDQDYLWVFSETQFGCLTHASVVSRVEFAPSAGIIRSSNIPDLKGIDSLYPCDDGTLVVSVKGGPVYSAAYRVNLKSSTITAYDGKNPIGWKKIRDSETRGGLEKLPVFCWPQFESLTETLETFQGAFSAHGAHA